MLRGLYDLAWRPKDVFITKELVAKWRLKAAKQLDARWNLTAVPEEELLEMFCLHAGPSPSGEELGLGQPSEVLDLLTAKVGLAQPHCPTAHFHIRSTL